MIAFPSSNLLMLPELPSLSRARERERFARYKGGAGQAGHCPQELQRWIGRWENEGGAVRGDAGEANHLKILIADKTL